MGLISKHPFSFLFAGAGIVLLAIALSVRDHAAPATGYGPLVSISAGNTLINPGMSNVGPIADAQRPAPIAQSSTTYVPIPTTRANTPTDATTLPIISSGTQTPPPAAPNASDQLLKDVYSLIPSGFTIPAGPKSRTPVQQALFDYGNKAGSIVLSLDNAHTDMAQVLKDWLADRTNAGKVAGVRSIAQDMQGAGQSLAALTDVPSAAFAANQALAKGYSDAGDKLVVVVTSGGSDTTLVEAMKTYNTTADSYTTAFVSLAEIFSLYDVTFSEGDPGSAFQFSQ